ncbi:DUF445 domain-containing protein [Calderihabitans maritimus]|uniref:DUF445 domain-containing protein n=1 Tax=Calderihabitans maritimus TaxID=1246530 RepID=A0A1Z5HRG6_9FIRM|nr:DUF445 family protein [Calderihabitans maritimus]GAW92038.1 hypothetical protein TherJR_1879 [Calderihabitans maritimus]
MKWHIFLIPVVGAVIGWITNVIAIKLIFWPYQPLRIPLTNFWLQGLIPKRRSEMARNVGEVIEKELFSIDDLLEYLNNAETQQRTALLITNAVRDHLIERLPSFIPHSIRDFLASLLEDIVRREAPVILGKLVLEIGDELKEKIKVGEIIEEKMNKFDLKKLENVVLQVATRELKHIEFLGAVIGFFIGLAQVGLLLVLERIN